jgi:hypothetical protein
VRFGTVAAFALAVASSAGAQTIKPPSAAPSSPVSAGASASLDFSSATPVAGNWQYSSSNGASEARFVGSQGQVQLTFRCRIAERRITISKPASGAAPFLNIWTSAQTRSLPAGFLPATNTLNADVSAYDPLLDAIIFSRGRIAVGVAGQSTLVVPAWAEAERVIEDCRA